MSLSYPIQPTLWSAPPVVAPRPTLWSARRTVLAIVVAVGIGSLAAVAVSYTDTGSASTGPFRNGQFQGPAGGRFNGGPFGGRQFGGPLGNGQQGGPLQGGQLGSAPSGLPGAR